MDQNRPYSCLACGSSRLVFGYLSGGASLFVPSGIFTMNGFKTRTYVCLDCGQLGHFLSQERLTKLREKYTHLQFEGEAKEGSPDG